MKKTIAKILIFTILFNICSPVFSQTTDSAPKEYTEEEFPQALHDLRRFEIITLGALPFVTLNSTLVYSGIKWIDNDFDPAYSPNPFAPKSDSGYSTEEQVGVLLVSLGISVGIGLTDYIVRVVKRNSKKKKSNKANKNISISTIENDPTATKITLNKDGAESKEETSKNKIIEKTDEPTTDNSLEKSQNEQEIQIFDNPKKTNDQIIDTLDIQNLENNQLEQSVPIQKETQ